jgi:hypothetical protein
VEEIWKEATLVGSELGRNFHPVNAGWDFHEGKHGRCINHRLLALRAKNLYRSYSLKKKSSTGHFITLKYFL